MKMIINLILPILMAGFSFGLGFLFGREYQLFENLKKLKDIKQRNKK